MRSSTLRTGFSSLAAGIAAALLLPAGPAQADDWMEKAFRSQQTTVTTTRTARKTATAKPRTAKPTTAQTVTTTWTPPKRTVTTPRVARQSKPVTIRAARFDDATPRLRQQSAAPVTSGAYESGIASYYWQPQPVASGGRFDPEAMTAAHKTLPFGTRVRVTRADNGRSVVVTINDRGPFIAGRIIDLSRRAARDIGMTDIGITRVNVAVLGR